MSQLLNPIGKRKEVMRLNPVDFRYTPLKVDRELEGVIYCKKHAGTQPIVFKLGPGWTSDNEKEVRFLAVEGNPMVSFIKADKGKVEESVPKFLEHVWGEKAYKNMDEVLKRKLEESSVGVTVTVAPFIPKDVEPKLQQAFDEAKADSMLYESDLQNTATFGISDKVKKTLDKIVDRLPWVLAGIGLTYILQGANLIRGL